MKPIVIYKSHTGHTEEYGRMLARSLNCQAVSLKEISQIQFSDYSIVLFGGCVRASTICGVKKLIKETARNPEPDVIVFAVGANGKSDENTKLLKEKNLVANGVDYPLFYLQGGFEPEKLNIILRAMLNKVAKSIEKKQIKEPESLSKEDKEFLMFFQSSHNDVSENNLSEILSYLELNS